MIGQDSDANGIRHLLCSLEDRLDKTLIQVVNGLELQVEVTIMSCFISSFYVNKDEVIFLQGFYGGLCLTFVICVSQSCGARYLDDAQTCVFADALDEVDS